MSLLVDTSVWSLALRRDGHQGLPEVQKLQQALALGQPVVTTGLILQELLQGFNGPKATAAIIERFSVLPVITPEASDHIKAAEIRNSCRRAGVQIGTIDAVLIAICQRYEYTLLSADQDFVHAQKCVSFSLWVASAPGI